MGWTCKLESCNNILKALAQWMKPQSKLNVNRKRQVPRTEVWENETKKEWPEWSEQIQENVVFWRPLRGEGTLSMSSKRSAET